ncbi:MAG: hypothetical protein HC764_24550 [Pleurocapsa sp. CRU_1_2]|nr:hypothetical protein [Pleurocapsa sp. CRU_1_2]
MRFKLHPPKAIAPRQTSEVIKYKHPHRRPNLWGCLFNDLFNLIGV